MRKSKPMTHGEKTQMHNIMGLGTIAQSYFQVSIKKTKVRWPVQVMPQIFFSSSTCARTRGRRAHVNFHMRTWTTFTCARGVKKNLRHDRNGPPNKRTQTVANWVFAHTTGDMSPCPLGIDAPGCSYTMVHLQQFLPRDLGSAKAPPAGPSRAQPPNVFWCILGIILRLFECLND